VEATQLYETAIYDRESGHAFRSVTLPSRSLLGSETHDASVTAEELGFERTIRLEPVEVWSLPFLIDSVLRRQDGPYFQDGPFIEFMSWGVGRQQGRGPSTFAQHLVFSPVIPFEESPQEGKSRRHHRGSGRRHRSRGRLLRQQGSAHSSRGASGHHRVGRGDRHLVSPPDRATRASARHDGREASRGGRGRASRSAHPHLSCQRGQVVNHVLRTRPWLCGNARRELVDKLQEHLRERDQLCRVLGRH